ncbi:MAG TPA: rhodanese-like domain-containing protein [Verrucomicrobiae bacterium]|nr:rhodanese-like domain-containing protein [Verrucomicrobiae bacterium]
MQPTCGWKANQRGVVRLSLLLETLVVAAIGMGLALAANSLSPRGLSLTRNYFPGGHAATLAAPSGTNDAAHAASAGAPGPQAVLAAQLRQEGLGLADSNEVVRLFHDPRTQQGQVIFIDARDDEHYTQGHIPGAYQLDYYHPGTYLATVLPMCQIAQQIVVYCNGGDCEDSKHTAVFLRDAGVPGTKLLVYAGGIGEWTTNGLPVETGARNSGVLLEGKPANP